MKVKVLVLVLVFVLMAQIVHANITWGPSDRPENERTNDLNVAQMIRQDTMKVDVNVVVDVGVDVGMDDLGGGIFNTSQDSSGTSPVTIILPFQLGTTGSSQGVIIP